MSPEAVNGEAGCAKSDVWALGCVLYEAASLRPPFVASNPMALAVAIDDV
jgi:serine/threonine protein kinase